MRLCALGVFARTPSLRRGFLQLLPRPNPVRIELQRLCQRLAGFLMPVRFPQGDALPQVGLVGFRIQCDRFLQVFERRLGPPSEHRGQVILPDAAAQVHVGIIRIESDRAVEFFERFAAVLERQAKIAWNRLAIQRAKQSMVLGRFGISRHGLFGERDAGLGCFSRRAVVAHLGRNFGQIGVDERRFVVEAGVLRLLGCRRRSPCGRAFERAPVLRVTSAARVLDRAAHGHRNSQADR